jgi:hypothetical protein
VLTERHAGDASHQVAQRRVLNQIFQQLPVRGCHQLHAALGDRAACERLGLGPDLVNDDHFGHVVLHSLYHHAVLLLRVGHLRRRGAGGGKRGGTVSAAQRAASAGS